MPSSAETVLMELLTCFGQNLNLVVCWQILLQLDLDSILFNVSMLAGNCSMYRLATNCEMELEIWRKMELVWSANNPGLPHCHVRSGCWKWHFNHCTWCTAVDWVISHFSSGHGFLPLSSSLFWTHLVIFNILFAETLFYFSQFYFLCVCNFWKQFYDHCFKILDRLFQYLCYLAADICWWFFQLRFSWILVTTNDV